MKTEQLTRCGPAPTRIRREVAILGGPDLLIQLFFNNRLSSASTLSMSLLFLMILSALLRRPTKRGGVRAFFFRLHSGNRNLLMNLGILGTFIGICLALSQFDANDIDGSVPALLEGMKLAFATSVLGVVYALLLNMAASFSPNPQGAISPLRALTESIEAMGEKIVTTLREDASQADAGRKEMATLLTASFETIRGELAGFGRTLAESNSKALLEALRDIIHDFNDKLTEQFGENFRELNRAVGALLTWQENYRHSVEEMEAQFERSLEGISRCETSLEAIRKGAEALPETMESLAELLQGLDAQNREATALLGSFAHLREQAGEALPLMEQRLQGLTEDLAESTKRFVRNLEETMEQETGELTKLSQTTAASVRENAETIHELLSSTLHESQELLKSQFKAFDGAMESELREAISQLGSHLAALSAKFVDDYTPLTESLSTLIHDLGRDLPVGVGQGRRRG